MDKEGCKEEKAFLKASGVTFLWDAIQKDAKGKYIAFTDPFGNISELIFFYFCRLFPILLEKVK